MIDNILFANGISLFGKMVYRIEGIDEFIDDDCGYVDFHSINNKQIFVMMKDNYHDITNFMAFMECQFHKMAIIYQTYAQPIQSYAFWSVKHQKTIKANLIQNCRKFEFYAFHPQYLKNLYPIGLKVYPKNLIVKDIKEWIGLGLDEYPLIKAKHIDNRKHTIEYIRNFKSMAIDFNEALTFSKILCKNMRSSLEFIRRQFLKMFNIDMLVFDCVASFIYALYQSIENMKYITGIDEYSLDNSFKIYKSLLKYIKYDKFISNNNELLPFHSNDKIDKEYNTYTENPYDKFDFFSEGSFSLIPCMVLKRTFSKVKKKFTKLVSIEKFYDYETLVKFSRHATLNPLKNDLDKMKLKANYKIRQHKKNIKNNKAE